MNWLWQHHADNVEFVALFGSRARGDALEDSDYDLLIGLRREDGQRITDRIGIFQDQETGRVHPLAYSPSELLCMMASCNGLLLEALADGRTLFDRGSWEAMQRDHRARVRSGELRRVDGVWEVRTSG